MKNDQWQFVVRTSDFYLSLFICHFAIGHLSSVTLPASSVLCVSDTGHAGCVRSQGHGEKSFPASEGFSASLDFHSTGSANAPERRPHSNTEDSPVGVRNSEY